MSNSIERRKNPILILGGTGAIGSRLAFRLATSGFETILGSKGSKESQQRFHLLSKAIIKSHGIPPSPFYANLAEKEEITAAVDTLVVPKNQPIDVFATAAEGLNFYKLSLGRKALAPLRKKVENGSLTKDDLISFTLAIRDVVLNQTVLDKARESNKYGSLRVLELLRERGNITCDSVVATFSSSESDDTDPKNIGCHPGPWFYFPVGISKKEQVLETARLASQYGFSYVDIVAPMVRRTAVGDWGLELISWVRSAKGISEISEVPSISRKDAVSGFVAIYLGVKGNPAHFQSETESSQKWYLDGSGLYSRKRPAWPKPSLPYL